MAGNEMITREQFEAMAARGRLWKADEPTPRTPSDAELGAGTPRRSTSAADLLPPAR
jgi:hypothetical protein